MRPGRKIGMTDVAHRDVCYSSVVAQYQGAAESSDALLGLAQRKWLRALLIVLRVDFEVTPITLYEDNQGCIAISDPLSKDHGRTKHIDVHYHFCREAIEDGHITVKYCPTEDMRADIMTKALPQPAHARHKYALNVRSDADIVDGEPPPKKVKSVVVVS